MTSVAGATNAGQLAYMLANIANTQANIANLTAETSSGYLAATYDGLGSAAAPALDLTSAVALNKTLQANTAAAATIQQVSQTALGQIQTLLAGISSQLLSPSTATTASLSTLSASANSALQQVANLLDTQSGGVYVFAGQDSSNPPIPNPDRITASSFYTAIGTALANLPTSTAAAVQAQIITAASPGATSPFSATLEASNLPATIDLGGGNQVQVGILADQNLLATNTGIGTTSTGSTMRDIVMGLATLGNLNGSNPAAADVQSMLSTVQTVLNNADTALNTDIGGLGVQQNTITAAQSEISGSATALTTQLGNLQDADPATVSTQLAQAQTQLQASFSVIASLQQLTLAKYLT